MKYLFLLIPFFSYAQQDSIVYSKGVRASGDSTWYRETFTKIGDSIIYSKVPWTQVDSLVTNTLINERHDAANQYRLAKIKWEEDEKSYKQRLRQPTKQLNDLFKKSPDGPRDTLKGAWKFNGANVTITNDRFGGKRITWYSQDVFEYNKEIFFRRNKQWVSDKSILSKYLHK